PFNQADPLFAHDLGFYVFTLPAYGLARDWGLLIVFLSAALGGGIYWGRGAIDVEEGFPRLSPAVVRHASVLLALFFFVKAGDYVLQRYELLVGSNGVVFGAAYTDVHLRLPLLTLLVVVSLIGAVLSLANIVAQGFRLPVAAVVLLVAVTLTEG